MPRYRRHPVTAEQYRTNAWGVAGVELMWVHARYSNIYGRQEPLALADDEKAQAPGVETTKGFQRVSDGDWIVTDEDGRHLYTDREFRRLFEAVDDLRAAVAGRFDGVDVDAFVAAQRDDDAPEYGMPSGERVG